MSKDEANQKQRLEVVLASVNVTNSLRATFGVPVTNGVNS